ncbi:MAG: cytochrome c oxidase accessory protein CcoG [Rhodothermales bacterium]|nr:cytochrome c oxidase accessory protein CcoG [Rhodothermales bacterium]
MEGRPQSTDSLTAVLESPEEVLSTMSRDGKRKWLYPVPSKGSFHTQRLLLGWSLIVLFVALPIIHIGGKPAVLLDIAQREFSFFGVTFYPTDSFVLLLFMVGVLLTVILATALLGRVWCGWGCPQTVYLEFVYRPIERWIEGPEHVRARRNAGPWTFDKVWRKTLRFGVYLAISLALAHIFLAYFVGWKDLGSWLTRSPFEHWGSFLVMSGTTGLILFDFGYFREQMCMIACPYARMQSVLVDKDSMILSYDPNRGEPRAKRSKKIIRQEEEGFLPAKGDCIDCFACVRTCPTGIDIRDGLQMECVACTQCIDACDSIMDKIEKPRGLIRYTSENALSGIKTRRFRPRTLIYMVLLLAVWISFGMTLTSRDAYDINIGRVVGSTYDVLPDGQVANRLRFRVRNQTGAPTSFTVSMVDPPSATVQIAGASTIELDDGEMKRVEAFVFLPQSDIVEGVRATTLRFSFSDGTEQVEEFTLIGPTP